MTVARYAGLVVGLVGASLAVLLPFLADDTTRAATVMGGVLASMNTVLAHFLATWSAGRSTQAFMTAVLGGMLGRMALMLSAVVASILLLDLPKVPLAVSLLSYFVVFLVMELTVLQRATTDGPQAVAR